MENITFKRPSKEDIFELTKIMKRAFDKDSMMHLNCIGGPEGYDDGSFLTKWGLHKEASSYVIYVNRVMAGAAILWIKPSNENFLGCLFIDDKMENTGLGTKVWKKIETMYPETIVWRTETPIFSHRNHNFYVNKCGFHIVKIENPKDYQEGQFDLEKKMV